MASATGENFQARHAISSSEPVPLAPQSSFSPPAPVVDAVRLVLGPPCDSSPHSSAPSPKSSRTVPPYSLSHPSPLPTWTQPPVSLVWFRGHDLRVHDHPALDTAVSTGGPIVALYILECGAENDGTVIYPRRRAAFSSSHSTSSASPAGCSFSTTSSGLSTPSIGSLNFSSLDSLSMVQSPELQDYSSKPMANTNPCDPTASTSFEPNHCAMPEPMSPTADFALGRVPRWYLHHSLNVLSNKLAELGITLVIRRVDSATHTVDQVVAVACSLGANAVFWNKRYKPNAYPIDDAVALRLRQHNIFARDFASETLVTPDVESCGTFNDFQSYTRFCISSFRKCPPPLPKLPLTPSRVCAMSRHHVSTLLETSEREYLRYSPMPSALDTTLPLVADLGLLNGIDFDGCEAPGDPSKVGCDAAVQTLHTFLAQDKLSQFAFDAARREGMVTGKDLATSRLSPHIRFGEISPRVIFYSIVEAGSAAARAGDDNGLRAARTFLKNMSLREFAYYMLTRYPCASRKPIVSEFEVFPWREDPAGELERAWEQGLTGFPIVDAAMRQLWREGWLHNKMRFLVASFHVKFLMLPWPIGAAHLVRTLVDGDEACNSLGWQWTAGTNSDSFPFSTLVNPLSIHAHSRSTQRAAAYVRKYVPELAHLPDSLLFTPWKATSMERRHYKLDMLPLHDYFSIAKGGLPPMADLPDGQRSQGVLYPMRIVDLRNAREKSLQAMDLMRRIFSSQKSHRTVIVDQLTSDTRSMLNSSMGGNCLVRQRTIVDEDGNELNELDLTSDDTSTCVSSDLSTSSVLSSPQKRHYPVQTHGPESMQFTKKRKVGTSNSYPSWQTTSRDEKNGDLLALCEAVNMKQADVYSKSLPTYENSTLTLESRDKQPSQGVGSLHDTLEPQPTVSGKGRKSMKRPRRASSERRSGGGLSVHSLLSSKDSTCSRRTPPTFSNDLPTSDPAPPLHADSCHTLKVPYGGLPRLAHVALQHGNTANDISSPAPGHNSNHNSNNYSLNAKHSSSMSGNLSENQQNGSIGDPRKVVETHFMSDGGGRLPSISKVSPARIHNYSPSQAHSRATQTVEVVGNPVSPCGPGVSESQCPSDKNNNSSFNMNHTNPTNRLSAMAFDAAANASGAGLYNPQVGAVPVVQNIHGIHNLQNLQSVPNSYTSLSPAPQSHAQHPLLSYQHNNSVLPLPTIPNQLPQVHNGAGSQAYFAAGNNHAANQLGQALFWYPAMQPYVDFRTGLPTAAVVPHMMQSLQPTPGLQPANPMALGYAIPGNIPGGYDTRSALNPVIPPVVPPETRLQLGPNTPQEREATARRMAAMDYHDDTYGGKHWEQWQAIAIHLLNSYEFCEDTDRETSKAYVRLCVLKDELRDANPNGPRVTVNHCKEVFKILRLPVTGEWDRRGHGGVRGPYVYGCCKRDQNATSSFTPTKVRHGNR